MMILTSIYRQLNKKRAKWPFFYVYRLSSSQASTKLFVKADLTISSGVKWTVKNSVILLVTWRSSWNPELPYFFVISDCFVSPDRIILVLTPVREIIVLIVCQLAFCISSTNTIELSNVMPLR